MKWTKIGKFWCFCKDPEKCHRKGYVENYKFWSYLNNSDYPIDFEEEKRIVLKWCEDSEADEMQCTEQDPPGVDVEN